MLEKIVLCKCGCGGTAPLAPHTDSTHGLVKGMPQDFIHGHNRRKSENEMYKVDSVSGCWLWQLGVSGNYGMIDQQAGHTLMYRKYRGEIPPGCVIDHVCRNTRCVNPEHLEVVTPAINVQRGRLAKLKPEDVLTIRYLFASGGSKVYLAERFKVTKSNIHCVVTRKSWKNL